jgi:K+-sensing histidine kinase KdpD
VTRTTTAWLAGLVPGALALAVLRALEVDSDVIALVALVPVVVAAAIGGRRVGLRVGAAIGVAYAVALLAPFGHFRIGLTRDMLALAVFVGVGAAVGELADRRRPVTMPEAPTVAGDPTALIRAVSHDLRNPLSTIRAASSDLLHGGHTDDPARRDELLGLVVTETERLDRIVGNLLHAGRARAGRIVPDVGPEALRAVVGDSLDRLAQVHPQRLVNEVPGDLPAVMIDVVLFDQVLANLVDNAARVSPADSSIVVGAGVDGGCVAVEVRDQGPGFGFVPGDPFEAYVTAGGSSGLGLAICRAIVEAHGGTITLLAVAAGACVRFTVPVADV